MTDMNHSRSIAIPFGDHDPIAALVDEPADPQAAYVFAHGAGAGMDHRFMAEVAQGLASRGIAVLRFQFPYMQQGGKRPDPPALAQSAVRAAVQEAVRRWPGLPLFAGGKSFGGRMTSQAQAAQPLEHVRGLVLAGFPLHPAGKPSVERARHLASVGVPMLFLQGTRDALAELALVREAVAQLGSRAALHIIEGGDHSFEVLVRSGRTGAQVRDELLDAMTGWMTNGA